MAGSYLIVKKKKNKKKNPKKQKEQNKLMKELMMIKSTGIFIFVVENLDIQEILILIFSMQYEVLFL